MENVPSTPAMQGAPAVGPYRVPPEPRRWPAIALAAAVHAALLLFLWIGISWQNTEPVAVEAEVWDMKVQDAAPPPLPEPAAAEPEPAPAPPIPKAALPAPPVERPAEKPPEPKAPDIALEREKIRQQKLAQQREAAEELKAKQLAQQKAEQKAEQKKAEQKAEQLAEQKAEKLAEQKAEQLARQKAAEADKKLAQKQLAENKAKAAREAADEKRLKDLRDAEMRRITGAAGTSGEAPKSTAPRSDSGYKASITSKIKSTTSYGGSTDLPGNPRAAFKVEQLPTGEIISVRLVKSSGVPGFDDAVEKGIMKSSPLPKKKDGTVERTLDIGFSMKDLD